MSVIKQALFVYTLFALCISQSVIAAQYAAEKHLSNQLIKSLKVGEGVMLKSGEREFLGIYTSVTTPKSRGGVILLHDLGAHANWPELIAPLRSTLPDYGWNTLSLQLPLLSNHPSTEEYSALFKEAQTRIAVAISYFGDKGIFNITLLGYGAGGAMGLNYLASTPENSKVIAFAGLAVYDHPLADDSLLTTKAIADVKIPVLDVAGNLDSDRVTESAKARQTLALKASNKKYHLLMLPGSDHFFSGVEQVLIKRLRAWLKKQAPSMEIGAGGVIPVEKKK